VSLVLPVKALGRGQAGGRVALPMPGSREWERGWERDSLSTAASCSLVLGYASADLRRCGLKWGGGVVVAILTSEGSLVRTQLRTSQPERFPGDLDCGG
jgi:hypothetical protein